MYASQARLTSDYLAKVTIVASDADGTQLNDVPRDLQGVTGITSPRVSRASAGDGLRNTDHRATTTPVALGISETAEDHEARGNPTSCLAADMILKDCGVMKTFRRNSTQKAS